ncbi:MAG TPA: CusA/CzcA family heavy metal efflux RND transporter, partial [Leptospiraceae bacterium]|nr:CusA/CzcA family heavy metal efflux RND transporter [Leptospiraceae bacterium]
MKLLSAIVEWSLANRLIVLAGTFIFVLYGINAARHLKIDAVPDVTTIQVQVITSAPALSPLEIEQYVTFAVERTMAGIPRVEEVRSVSRYGLSVVTIVFKDGTDIFHARQMVGERLKEAGEAIPRGYGTPFLGPISTGLGEIFQFTLRSEKHSLMELTTLLNWYVNPMLKTVPGVVEVNTFGGESKQYQIILNTERMQSLGLSIRDVTEALQKNNAAMGGGYIEHNKEHFLIGAEGLAKSLEDLKKIPLGRTKQGIPMTLGTVSDVRQGPKLRLGASSRDGIGEEVGGITLMLMHENSLEVTEAVKEKLKEVAGILPAGVEIVPFYDRSEMVKTTVRTVMVNLTEGAVLVIIVLFLLLGSIRAGLVIAVTIPLGMLFAISIMKMRDLPGNLMSMGAIDFGLIVDGAVIIIENAVRRISIREKELGRALNDEERTDTVRFATLEVRKATIFGETIIAVVYLPVLALGGVEGKMFIPMALTVLYALLGAFVLSLTVVPVLASYLLRGEEDPDHETWLFRKIKIYYEPLLNWFMQKREKTVFGMAGFLAFSILLFMNLGGEFMPQLDEGSMLLEVARLPSVSLSESVQTSGRLEAALLKKVPEIVHAVSKTGAPDIATDPMGIDRTDTYLNIKPKEEWRFGKDRLIREIEDTVSETVPEVAISVSQPIQMRTNELIAGIRSDIGVKIFGDSLEELKTIGEKTAEILKKIEGVKDLKIEQLQGLNYIRIRPKRESLARYGVDIFDINQITESLSSGHNAGVLFEGRMKFDITVKLENTVSSLDDIRAVPVRAEGQLVPLGDLASVDLESGPVQIGHENGYRRMLVEFNVRERDMMSVIQEAQEKLSSEIKLP